MQRMFLIAVLAVGVVAHLAAGASTGDGRVTLDFPVKISGSLSKSRIHGPIQEGGQRLELRTGDSAIHVSRL